MLRCLGAGWWVGQLNTLFALLTGILHYFPPKKSQGASLDFCSAFPLFPLLRIYAFILCSVHSNYDHKVFKKTEIFLTMWNITNNFLWISNRETLSFQKLVGTGHEGGFPGGSEQASPWQEVNKRAHGKKRRKKGECGERGQVWGHVAQTHLWSLVRSRTGRFIVVWSLPTLSLISLTRTLTLA